MSRNRNRRRWCVIALALFAASHLRAQTIQGFVRDSASSTPVAGAVISALDSAGRPLARVVSDGNGHYHLPTQRVVTLYAQRIGFRPRSMPLPAGSSDRDVSFDIAMVVLPRLLDPIVVTENRRCRGPGQAEALALWEQVRSALLASEVARGDSVNTLNVRFERTIDPQTHAITQQTFTRNSGPRISPFVAAYPASEFAVRGYMDEDATGRTFSAPDADVLLDPAFATSHCFGVRSDAAHSGQIGLTFRPAKNDDEIVDVTGALWVDTARPGLRSLDFSYTSLEPAAGDAPSGGVVSFKEMRPGVVFIDRWSIRIAVLTVDDVRMPEIPRVRSRRFMMRLLSVHESGGEVVSAAWADGIRWHNTLGQIAGRLTERGSARPSIGQRIQLLSSPDTVVTDSLGRFQFTDLVPGPYVVAAADTRYASYGLGARDEKDVIVERGATTAVALSMPPLADRIRDYCRGAGIVVDDTAHAGTILGRILLPDGSPANNAIVDARRLGPGEGMGDVIPSFGPMSNKADRLRTGTFIICGVERGRTMLFRIAHPHADTTDARVQLADDERVREIIIRMNPLSPAPPTRESLLGRFTVTDPYFLHAKHAQSP